MRNEIGNIKRNGILILTISTCCPSSSQMKTPCRLHMNNMKRYRSEYARVMDNIDYGMVKSHPSRHIRKQRPDGAPMH